MFSHPRVNYAGAVKSSTATTVASCGGSVEQDDSYNAVIASVPLIGANEQTNEQVKCCVSTVEPSLNTSELTAADSHQLAAVPARKPIFKSRLSSCIAKEAIVEFSVIQQIKEPFKEKPTKKNTIQINGSMGKQGVHNQKSEENYD
uniref:Uncharacterized protein n=1 Tax=Glossina pallidipes TaxID=7398 RepID=A0A1A9ZJX9_GLOPL